MIVVGLVAVLVIGPALMTPNVTVGITPGPIAFLVVGMAAGAIEDPAWRVHGQAALQRRLSIVAASLVVGVAWAAWHLPMLWLEGTYQHGLGIGTSGFWTFPAPLVVSSPIYTWLFNASGQVVFAAVLFHAVGNLGAELIADAGTDTLVVAATAVVAVLLVAASWPWMRSPSPTLQTHQHVN